ncbi:FIG01056136: hypothetical protein [plant metagenome]|uniref:histidine kinase n=1 Tax=plant metagenome TaxID=1297885 RepID=A0A484UYS3_9ZZZZ
MRTRLRRILSRPGPAEPLSDRARARLLDMTQARLVFSITVTPLVGTPFLFWLWELGSNGAPLLAWILAYGVAALGARVLKKRYALDRLALAEAAFLEKWLPLAYALALGHGIGLALVLGVTWVEGVHFDFKLLLFVGLLAIMSGNASHQTPVLRVFLLFFAVSWGSILLTLPWSFPQHWHYILPLALLFTLAILVHAFSTHRFFLQQVRLEEEGLRLAQRFRKAKEEAEQALQDKNRFLSTASHDLRQPMHAMGFHLEAIAALNRDPALTAPLGDLRRSLASINLMFNSLLDLSRIESGTADQTLSAVDLVPILREVGMLFREEAKSRGLAWRLRLPRCGQAIVLGNVVLVRQCVINLAHNALRYTEAGGVLLSLRRRGGDWMLEVWDTGVGVGSEEQPRIYSPFYRNEHAWRADSAGHGLGLAVVARCAAMMGTGYGLTSALGRGSRFWLRFSPSAAPAPAGGAQVPAAPRDSEAAGRLPPLRGTCLVVDDDPQVVAAWSRMMRIWGVEAECATCAAEALAVLDAGFQPRAILCDQRLRSGESGLEILKALSARCPDAAGAMVSGEYDSPVLKRAEEEGYLVLHKPVDPDRLYWLLSTWFGAQQGGRDEGGERGR